MNKNNYVVLFMVLLNIMFNVILRIEEFNAINFFNINIINIK